MTDTAFPCRLLLAGSLPEIRKHRRELLSLKNRNEAVFTGRLLLGEEEKDGEELPSFLGDLPPVKPEDVKDQDFSYILTFASEKEEDPVIEKILLTTGCGRDRLIPVRVLRVPGLRFPEYLKIRESRPTIFSNICWAGLFYNALGMECLSPTKNLWMYEHEYLRFLRRLDHYLAEEPVFDHMQKALSSSDKPLYPVLRLDDILLFCNHLEDPEEAISDWKRRTALVNRDNVLAVLVTEVPKNEVAFARLPGFPRKLCLVPFRAREASTFYLPKWKAENFMKVANGTAFPGKNPFDIYSLFFEDKPRALPGKRNLDFCARTLRKIGVGGPALVLRGLKLGRKKK